MDDRSNGRNMTTRSIRFRNSGRKVVRSARSASATLNAPAAGSNPTPVPAAIAEPTLDVRTITDRRKSTSCPCESVSRPSSKTWRKTSHTGSDAFSNSSSRHDAERVAADGGDQPRAPPADLRVGEEPLQRLRRLELAHVEPDEPLGRAEQEPGERLCDLRLARAGRTEEEEDAERPTGIREPRLDHRDPLDDAGHGVRLLQDALVEERADVLEVQRRRRIEEGEGQPGRRGERGEHVAPVEPREALVVRLERGRVDEAEKAARRCDSGEELLRKVGAPHEGLVVRRDVHAVVLERMPRDGDRVLLVERSHADRLERRHHPRSVRPDDVEGRRRDLGDERHRAGLDVREHGVEKPLRAAMVLAGEERLLELGQHPDRVPSAHPVRELLHAALDLPDEDLAGDHLRRRRLEHRDIVDPVECGARERGLPGSVLADEQDRASRLRRQRRDDEVDDLAPAAREEGRRSVERALPDPADRAEELEDAPLLERKAHLIAHVPAEAMEVALEVLGLCGRHVAAERLDVDGLARLDPRRHEVGDVLRVDPLGPAENAADRAPGGVPCDRAEQERVLAVRRARQRADRGVHPVRRGRRRAVRARRGPSTRRTHPGGARARSPRTPVSSRRPAPRRPPGSAARARASSGESVNTSSSSSSASAHASASSIPPRSSSSSGSSVSSATCSSSTSSTSRPARHAETALQATAPSAMSPTPARKPTMRSNRSTCGGASRPRRGPSRGARPAQPSSVTTSSSSGKRPSLCLEKTRLPSATTSYWLRSPLDGDCLVACIVERGRETRGPNVVAVSDGAVEDLDPHDRHPIRAVDRGIAGLGRHRSIGLGRRLTEV